MPSKFVQKFITTEEIVEAMSEAGVLFVVTGGTLTSDQVETEAAGTPTNNVVETEATCEPTSDVQQKLKQLGYLPF